jgi:hypothetical protein
MPTETDRSKPTVEDFASRFRQEMIPLSNNLAYFSATPLAEEDLKQYLTDPLAAISPAIAALLPKLGIVFVPYLEKGEGERAVESVSFEKPSDGRSLAVSRILSGELLVLLFAIKDEVVADYHYTFFGQIANLVADRWSKETQERFFRLLREELKSEVHGEVDERSWHLKQALLRRQKNVRNETKLFRDYARQAFEDTLILYLHGTCCDIEVATGPRQMPSRSLRKRLELLQTLYPSPPGFAVFPEQARRRN